jgi:hypothetical protein
MWQKDPNYAGGLPQWCFSKGFDKFAPIGPCIVSNKVRHTVFVYFMLIFFKITKKKKYAYRF